MRPKGTKTELEVRRRTAVALLEHGLGVREVARRVSASPGSVVRWREAYRQGGQEALCAKPHPGGKPRLSPADRQRLGQLLLEGPLAHGYHTELWTLARVAQVIERHFGVHYHPCHVFRILRAMRWSCQKPQRRARERNEAAIHRFRHQTWPRIKKSPSGGSEPGSPG
jgi:transposase